MALPDEIRAACARVAGAARHVRIDRTAVESYAATLEPAPVEPAEQPYADPEQGAAHLLQLDAVNFGSGWFPTLRKPPGLSGFRTVERGLLAHGPWSAAALRRVDAAQCATVFGQAPGHPLMALFAAALAELGAHVETAHGGAFLALARAGDGSAVGLAELLAALPTWRDVSVYDGAPVPLFKRAQLTAADVHRHGLAPAADIGALTLMADNLVPHVLRIDGVLEFAPALVDRIDREELLEHGSAEEVEIRACAVHAVELLVTARGDTTAAAVDDVLWRRGAAVRYKAHPRHRARTTAY
jgi:hypothetical protein